MGSGRRICSQQFLTHWMIWKSSCILHNKMTQTRKQRHPIFQQQQRHSTTKNSRMEETPESFEEASEVQSQLKQFMFQLNSIRSVIQRIDLYSTQIGTQEQQTKSKLQQFNQFANANYQKNAVVKALCVYMQDVQKQQEVINGFEAFRLSSPNNLSGVSIVWSGQLNLEGARNSLNVMLSQISDRRDQLFQRSVESEAGLATHDCLQLSRSLQLSIRESKTRLNELALFIYQDASRKHELNKQTLRSHWATHSRLCNVLDCMQAMGRQKPAMARLVEEMENHFQSMKDKLDSPEELLQTHQEFSSKVSNQFKISSRDKQQFDQNVCNSYIKSYQQELQQFMVLYIGFEKAQQQYDSNCEKFDLLVGFKIKLEQKMRRATPTADDIKAIRGICTAIVDLDINPQLNHYKEYIIRKHEHQLKNIGIHFELPLASRNSGLLVKARYFDRVVMEGLPFLSTNLGDLEFSKTYMESVSDPSLPQESDRKLRNHLMSWFGVLIKLVSTHDKLKTLNYQTLGKEVYDFECTSNDLIQRFKADYFEFREHRMPKQLQRLYFTCVRDWVILTQISHQYSILCKSLKTDAQHTTKTQGQPFERQDFQKIVPILKSIRNISDVNKGLREYLFVNPFGPYHQLTRNSVRKLNQKQCNELIQQLRQSPGHLLTMRYLCLTDQLPLFFRRPSEFVNQLCTTLKSVLKFICSEWEKFSHQTKMANLAKFQMVTRILKGLEPETQTSDSTFYNHTFQFLVQYLRIDTEIRIACGQRRKSTCDTAFLLNVIKMLHERSSHNYKPSITNEVSGLVTRLVYDLGRSCPCKVPSNMQFDGVIKQLRVLEVEHDISLLSTYDKMPPNARRALIYYYMVSILEYQPLLIEQGEILVQSLDGKVANNIGWLCNSAQKIVKGNLIWATSMQKRFNQQPAQMHRFDEFQSILLQYI